MVIRMTIAIFVLCLLFLQAKFPNRDINYVHFIDGRPTLCGMYYLSIFPILAYPILVFAADALLFGWTLARMCNGKAVRPALFHPDGRYGLRKLIGTTFYVHLAIVAVGVYFLVLFLSWRNFRSLNQLFDRKEHILIFIGYGLTSPLVLWWLLQPIRELLARFKRELLESMYAGLQLERLIQADPHSSGVMTELEAKGFYPMYDMVSKLPTRVLTYELFGKVYTSIVVPIIIPIATLWIQKEFFQ